MDRDLTREERLASRRALQSEESRAFYEIMKACHDFLQQSFLMGPSPVRTIPRNLVEAFRVWEVDIPEDWIEPPAGDNPNIKEDVVAGQNDSGPPRASVNILRPPVGRPRANQPPPPGIGPEHSNE
ncbi:uncharacterized protein LOC144477900 [Augochlora pura]